ncbi:hypothetical protein C4D60_Mb10t26420 [Musa balbisiana]|uniref:Uncharacterized protein n=1 Tax=Musa balbisiana TaxID=52838 RepID=A0A4S8J1F3_MUSBA|nr:hypothetical protein C4D60_Mb10t26420 [Musa balbisiana]
MGRLRGSGLGGEQRERRQREKNWGVAAKRCKTRGSGGYEASGGRRMVAGSGGGLAGRRRRSRGRGVLEEAPLRSTRGCGNRGSSVSATAARRGCGNRRLRLRPKGGGGTIAN